MTFLQCRPLRFNITQLPIPRPCISQELCFNEHVPNLDYETPEIDAMETLYAISLCVTDKRPLWSGTMQMVHDGPKPWSILGQVSSDDHS